MLLAAALSVIALLAWYGGGGRGVWDAKEVANLSQRQLAVRDGSQGSISGDFGRGGGKLGGVDQGVSQVVGPPEDLPSPSSPPR